MRAATADLDFLRYAWGGLMVNQFSGPKGDPVWLGGKTVLQHYNLKDYDDGSGYKWYQPDVVSAPCRCPGLR